MRKLSALYVLCAALASCLSASPLETPNEAANGRCSTVPIMSPATNACVTVPADFAPVEPSNAMLSVAADGPDVWTAAVKVEIVGKISAEESVMLCSLDLSGNGIAYCNRAFLGNNDALSVTVTVTPRTAADRISLSLLSDSQ